MEQFYTSKNKTFDRILCLRQSRWWCHPRAETLAMFPLGRFCTVELLWRGRTSATFKTNKYTNQSTNSRFVTKWKATDTRRRLFENLPCSSSEMYIGVCCSITCEMLNLGKPTWFVGVQAAGPSGLPLDGVGSGKSLRG